MRRSLAKEAPKGPGALRLLVCGSRKWGDLVSVAREIATLAPAVVIHGACSRVVRVGSVKREIAADMLADFVARNRGLPSSRSLPSGRVGTRQAPSATSACWSKAGPIGGLRSEPWPDRGLAFGALWKRDARMNDPEASAAGRRSGGWKRTGTGDMAKRMLDAGLPVRWVAAPGTSPVDLETMPGPPS